MIDASTIHTLRKLAMAATPGPWHIEKQDVLAPDVDGMRPVASLILPSDPAVNEAVGSLFGYERGAQDAKLFVALRNNIDELLRLAEIGQTPMNQRESPHCASCSCGTEPMLTTDTVPPEKRASICFECDPPAIVKDSDVGHCEREHGR